MYILHIATAIVVLRVFRTQEKPSIVSFHIIKCTVFSNSCVVERKERESLHFIQYYILFL